MSRILTALPGQFRLVASAGSCFTDRPHCAASPQRVGQVPSLSAHETRPGASDLEDVAIAGYDFVEDGVDEEAEDQAGDQAGDNDYGEGFLRVAAHAGGDGGGKQSETSYESGHHDGAKAKKRGFESGVADGFAFQAKLVDVADEDDRSFDGDAEKSQQTEDAR